MTGDPRQIVDEYVSALTAELGDLPAADRAEIITDVREHYEEACRELPDPTEAALRNILERLGSPSEIAAEARQSLAGVGPGLVAPSPAVTTAPPRALEVLTLIGWIAWWPLGLVLMAISSRWTRRAKVTAVLLQLGSVAVVLGVFSTPVYFLSGSHNFMLPLYLLFPPTLPGIVGAAYLAWKLTSPGHRRWSEAWRAGGRALGMVFMAWLLWVLILGPLTMLLLKGARI